ncbi:MAG: helix-turn-helix domain-containing protein, partial [Myxococcota bacterium]
EGLAASRGARPGLAGVAGVVWALGAGAFGETLVDEQAADVERRAAQAARAELVVEVACLRAIAMLSRDVAEGVRLARRASRAARTEGVLAGEYLANLVLCRARRASEKPFAASRIASSLVQICAPRWRAWLGWELAMLARPDEALRLSTGATPVAQLTEWFVSATRDARWAREGSPTMPVPWIARELGEWIACAGAAATPTAADFIRGATATPPAGAAGWVDDAGTWVCWSAARGARRYLSPIEEASTPDAVIDASDRVACALAVLALAGPDGLPIEELYGEVFGATYEARADGLLRTTLYRGRAAIAAHAELVRGDGFALLRPQRPFAVRDPRCAPGLAAHALRTLARAGSLTARELGDAMGMALRTAQKALRELVEEGLCQTFKDGRTVRYTIEDTTFSNPTIHRLIPKAHT